MRGTTIMGQLIYPSPPHQVSPRLCFQHTKCLFGLKGKPTGKPCWGPHLSSAPVALGANPGCLGLGADIRNGLGPRRTRAATMAMTATTGISQPLLDL